MKFDKDLQKNQFRLNILGYYRGKKDGFNGPLTIQAAKRFQKDHKLKIDGIIGPVTEKEIEIAFIKEVQERLLFLEKYDGRIDGKEGPKTKKGILSVQKMSSHLKNDGIVGPATWAFLDKKVVEKEKRLKENIKVEHFTKEEFRCHCGGRYCDGFGGLEPDRQLLLNLEAVRKKFGDNPITITSGFRCQQYNDSLPGSIHNSKHTKFKAADFFIHGGQCDTWEGREEVVAF